MADAPLTASALRRLADDLDAQGERESNAQLATRLEALEARVGASSPQRLDELLAQLSDDDVATLAERLRGPLGVAAREEEGRREEEEKPSGEQNENPPPRTRPGRKRGAAYRWTVDDSGEVVETELATIYNGEDEPDEVELPPLREQEAA